MIIALDVHYEAPHVAPRERACAARAAGLGFLAWTDADAVLERVVTIAGEPAAYEPGKFYLRELPCLLAVLAAMDVRPRAIVIDGYVTLAGGKPGLGGHLFDALDRRVAVVGVAKTPFRGAPAERVLRGASKTPLLVTAAGMSLDAAAAAIASMHGAHRIPTLLARVDSIARGTAWAQP